jgi:hypothetical protein
MSDVLERPEFIGRVDTTVTPPVRVVRSDKLVNFGIDKTDLKPGHVEYLDRTVVGVLRNHPWLRCVLEGSASNDKAGLSDYNFGVARKRGEEVKRFLAKRKVSNRQLILEEPIVGGDPGTQNAENRSVLVRVLEPVNTRFNVRLAFGSQVKDSVPGIKKEELVFVIRDVENGLVGLFQFSRAFPNGRVLFPFDPMDATSQRGDTLRAGTAVSLTDFNGAAVAVTTAAGASAESGPLDVTFTLGAGRGFARASRVPGSMAPNDGFLDEDPIRGTLISLIQPQLVITVPPVVFKV